MSSDINTAKINVNFPKPGIDNDTQGFRTNFGEIKTNIDRAKSEIEDLQNNTAKTNEDTNFNGSVIENAQLKNTAKTVFDLGNTATDKTVKFDDGDVHTVSVGGDVVITVAGWPDQDQYAELLLMLTADETTRTITWRTGNGGTVKTRSDFPDPFAVTSTSAVKMVKFWTVNSGNDVYAEYLGEFQ